MSGLPIRWRLTLWYSVILALILLGFSAGVYYLMSRDLLSRMDQSLREELQGVEKELEESSTTAGLRARLHRRFGHYEHVLLDIRYRDNLPPLFTRQLGETAFPTAATPDDSRNVHFTTFETADGGHWRIATRQIAGPEGPLLTRSCIFVNGRT